MNVLNAKPPPKQGTERRGPRSAARPCYGDKQAALLRAKLRPALADVSGQVDAWRARQYSNLHPSAEADALPVKLRGITAPIKNPGPASPAAGLRTRLPGATRSS